jgi:hypothetical protein
MAKKRRESIFNQVISRNDCIEKTYILEISNMTAKKEFYGICISISDNPGVRFYEKRCLVRVEYQEEDEITGKPIIIVITQTPDEVKAEAIRYLKEVIPTKYPFLVIPEISL